MIGLLLGLALAADPEPTPVAQPAIDVVPAQVDPSAAEEPAVDEPAVDLPAADEPSEDVADEPMEIVVWGEAAIRQARSDVIRELRKIGWKKGREEAGQVVFRPPEAWMGRAVLDYDGTLSFRRPVVAFKSARAANPVAYDDNPHFDRDPGGLAYPTDAGGTAWAAPHPEGSFWVLPTWSVLGPAHQRVRDRIAPQLEDYRAVVERTAEREGR